MQVTSEDLKGIMENMWVAVLGMPISPSDLEPSVPAESLTGCVHITGPWSGALVIVCAGPMSRRVAAAMFAMELADIGDAETRDALGELANIAGGNFKSLLPPGCQLSLPTVVEGGHYTLVVSNSHLVNQLNFDSDGHAVALKVYEQDADKAG